MPTLTIIHCLFWKAKKAKQRRVKRAPKQAHEQLQERQLPQNQDPSAAAEVWIATLAQICPRQPYASLCMMALPTALLDTHLGFPHVPCTPEQHTDPSFLLHL